MGIVTLNPGSIYTDMLVVCCGDLAAKFQSPQKWYVNTIIHLLFYHFIIGLVFHFKNKRGEAGQPLQMTMGRKWGSLSTSIRAPYFILHS